VVPPPKTAATYFQEGEAYFDKGLYEEAVAAWEKVRDSYYSPEMNVLAEMKIAEAYYLSERYVEAAAAYEDFLKQHPENERAREALYRLGMSYYQQTLSADRDQTATRNALVTFETFLQRYPDSPRAEEARAYTRRCEDLLAKHELYVGRFYLKTGHPRAAIGRFEGLFATYPNYQDRDIAWYYLGKAYLETGQRRKAAEAFNTLYRNFPGSEYIQPAQKYLEEHY
jgi:outer membrane protein assembly factor BamD